MDHEERVCQAEHNSAATTPLRARRFQSIGLPTLVEGSTRSAEQGDTEVSETS